MNIETTIQVMELKGVAVALDVGEHARCSVSSNCPVAIQLRKIIEESGITLTQLLEGYQSVEADPLHNVDFTGNRVSGKAKLEIMGTEVEVDLTTMVQSQVQGAFTGKLHELQTKEAQLQGLGRGLYETYLLEIQNRRKSKKLLQFPATVGDLIKYHCMITEEEGNYVFLFEDYYHPESYVTGGDRYQLSPAHAKRIARKVFLKLTINPDGVVISTTMLDEHGQKQQHYHGSSTRDCWGSVRLESTRSGFTLANVERAHRMAMGAVQTINMDSLLNPNPEGMPSSVDIRERGTKLGREGMATVPEEVDRPVENPARWNPTGGTNDEDEIPAPIVTRQAGWGGRR